MDQAENALPTIISNPRLLCFGGVAPRADIQMVHWLLSIYLTMSYPLKVTRIQGPKWKKLDTKIKYDLVCLGTEPLHPLKLREEMVVSIYSNELATILMHDVLTLEREFVLDFSFVIRPSRM